MHPHFISNREEIYRGSNSDIGSYRQFSLLVKQMVFSIVKLGIDQWLNTESQDHTWRQKKKNLTSQTLNTCSMKRKNTEVNYKNFLSIIKKTHHFKQSLRLYKLCFWRNTGTFKSVEERKKSVLPKNRSKGEDLVGLTGSLIFKNDKISLSEHICCNNPVLGVFQ